MKQRWNLDPLHFPDVRIALLDPNSKVPHLSDECVGSHATNGLDADKENHHDDILGQIQHIVFELEMRQELSILDLNDVMKIGNCSSGLEIEIAMVQGNNPPDY